MSTASALKLAMQEIYVKANHAHNKLDKALGHDNGNPTLDPVTKNEIEQAQRLVREVRTWAREFSDL